MCTNSNGKFTCCAPKRSSNATRLCCWWMSNTVVPYNIHITWVKSFVVVVVFRIPSYKKLGGFGSFSCRGPIFEYCCLLVVVALLFALPTTKLQKSWHQHEKEPTNLHMLLLRSSSFCVFFCLFISASSRHRRYLYQDRQYHLTYCTHVVGTLLDVCSRSKLELQ